MTQIIKRTAILFGIFAAALLLYFFTSREWKREGQTVYVDMGEASLPVVTVEMFGRTMNHMMGYCQEMDNSAAGDSLTILPEDLALAVRIDGAKDEVLGIGYEIRSMDRDRLVERTRVEDWEQTETGLRAVLPIQNLLTPEREYLLRLELNTEEHGPVYYYTRILKTEDTTAQPMIDLAVEFSAKTFDYEQARDLVTYLETSPTEDNSSFGRTTIRSSFSQLTWGRLKMKPAGPVQVTLKELDGIMGCVSLSYPAQRTTESEMTEYYEVEENFTMKWNEQRIYMMDYERQVNQVFQGNSSDFSGQRIMLGITNDERVSVEKSPDGNMLVYRTNRDLWSYDQKERQAVRIFSFRDQDAIDVRARYREHESRVLSVFDNGDVSFQVYGYMNRGNHEGKMGIVGYHYTADNNALEELYFIPYSGSYEALEDDLGRLTYLTEGGMLYLYMDHTVFGIDLRSRENMVVADALQEGSFAVSTDGSRIAWQEGGRLYEAGMLNAMDLETGEKRELRGSEGEYVRTLGFVGRDLVYGIAKAEDLWVINGRVEELPMRSVRIVNDQMQEESSYERKGYYIANVRVEDSRVHLDRVSKIGPGQYAFVQEDTIVCNESVGRGILDGIGWYASQDKGKQYFVQLSTDIRGGKSVRVSAPRRVTFADADYLDLKSNYQVQGMQFFAYGAGQLQGVTMDFTEAVQLAYQKMGYVTDKDHQILWSRVNRGSRCNIQNPMTVLEQVQRNLDDFADSRVYDSQLAVMDARGCSMQQMLYFLDQGIPVIGYTGDGSYLILCGFDQYNVTICDPATGEIYKAGLNDSTEFFKQSGNDFICAVSFQ